MARGTQLSSLRDMLKAELGVNQKVGTASDLEFNTLLSNMQKWLSSKYNFPQLRLRFDTNVGVGTRYVNVPVMNYERPVITEVKWSALWQTVEFGIGSEEFNYLDSDIGNGQDPVLRWDFAGQIGVPAPTAATATNSATAGNTGAGTYSYQITFVTAFGETSAGTSSNNVTPGSNKSIDVSNIPTDPGETAEGNTIADVTARKIYRTKSGGSTYFFVATLNDNTTTTYHDGAADSTLGANPPLYNTAEVTVMEIWPIPQSVQTVRFTGQRNLSSLVADTDTADLDDMLLIKLVAGNKLIRANQADGRIKLAEGQARLLELKQAYPTRSSETKLGGYRDRPYNKVVPIKIIATHG